MHTLINVHFTYMLYVHTIWSQYFVQNCAKYIRKVVFTLSVHALIRLYERLSLTVCFRDICNKKHNLYICSQILLRQEYHDKGARQAVRLQIRFSRPDDCLPATGGRPVLGSHQQQRNARHVQFVQILSVPSCAKLRPPSAPSCRIVVIATSASSCHVNTPANHNHCSARSHFICGVVIASSSSHHLCASGGTASPTAVICSVVVYRDGYHNISSQRDVNRHTHSRP